MLFAFVLSHDLRHEVTHCLGCLVLFLPGGVGIGAERKAWIGMPQHTGYCADIHAVLQGYRSEGMPL